jgi:hypothetical protein
VIRRGAAALALALLTALAAHASEPPGARQARGRPIARDAEQHVAAGVAASMAAAGLLTAVTPRDVRDIPVAAATGMAVALAAGIAKEVADALGLGTPEFRDLMYTATGGLVGATVAFLAIAGTDAAAGGRAEMACALLEGAALTAAVVLVRVGLPAKPGGRVSEKAAPRR